MNKQLKHTLFKTLSYALMHMSVAIIVAYTLSKSWKVALAIGTVEPCVQTVAFFFHERFWHKSEEKNKQNNTHNEIIDSTSPLNRFLEKILNHKH